MKLDQKTQKRQEPGFLLRGVISASVSGRDGNGGIKIIVQKMTHLRKCWSWTKITNTSEYIDNYPTM